MSGRRVTRCLAAIALGGVGVLAQPEGPPAGGDALDRPTEYGLRFTPGMARGLAGEYVRHVLVSRYGLEEARIEEAVEAVARRIMATAHRLDDDRFGPALERMVEGVMEGQLEAGGGSGIGPKSGRAIAEALRPAMPAIRELIRGVAQDIRPKLSPKAQLKFGADLLGMSAGLDVFEQTLHRWSRGEAQPGEQPFQDDDLLRRDESGHTGAYRLAERRARQAVEQGEWEGWRKYVEDARTFYGFDEAQAAGAESILRDCLDRAARYTASEEWKQQVVRNRLWANLERYLQLGSAHPVRHALQREYARLMDPIHQIGLDLKQRIDTIPTQAQRRAAEARVLAALGEQGFEELPAETEPESEEGEAGSYRPAEPTGPVAVDQVFDETGSANQEPAYKGARR